MIFAESAKARTQPATTASAKPTRRRTSRRFAGVQGACGGTRTTRPHPRPTPRLEGERLAPAPVVLIVPVVLDRLFRVSLGPPL